MTAHPKKTFVQVSTGELHSPAPDFRLVKEKIDQISSRVRVDGVLMGFCLDDSIYQKTLRLLHDKKIRLYLWFPVFSDLDSLMEFAPLVDRRGDAVRDMAVEGTGGFNFYCPSNRGNLANIRSVFEKHFAKIQFDGVFLDRVRYPSFSNGLDAIFTCFCPDCTAALEQCGVDVKQLKDSIEVVRTGDRAANPLGIKSYGNMIYRFEEPPWEKFFFVKARVIYHALRGLYRYFSGRGLEVGLDLFAPFLGYFVGQRPDLLCHCADFIKPMFYRVTQAPAGMPFELNALCDGLARAAPAAQQALRARMAEILGIAGYDGALIPADFMAAEIDRIAAKGVGGFAAIFPGVEFNRIERLAPVTPDYIRGSIRALEKTDADGTVFSWDLLAVPDDNLEAFMDGIRRLA